MKVSIAVPIYNVEKFIKRCACSLFEQTYYNIEYVFVNDKTPDKSIEILQEVISSYPRRLSDVKIIHHRENLGLAAARNTAVANCTGEFLIHVDSDDYIEKRMVERLVKKQLETDADIVSSAIFVQSFKQRIINEPEYANRDEMLINILSQKNNHNLVGRLIRSSIYNDNNLKAIEGNDYGEDWYMLPQIVYYSKKIALVSEPLYIYDCTNEKSYTYDSGNFEREREKHDKDITVLILIKESFADKELVYQNTIDSYLCKRLIDSLVNAINKNNYGVFQYLSNILLKMRFSSKPMVLKMGLLSDLLLYSPTLFKLYLYLYNFLFKCLKSRL